MTTGPLRALVVDDERLARARLRRLLAAHPEIHVVAEARDVANAADAFAAVSPDVVFLDIQMPGGSGLTLFERCRVEAQVVFVTAYDEHAVRAFETGALDYLLKPVEPERLALTVRRLVERLGDLRVPGADAPGARVSLLTSNGLQIVQIDRITHITGADDYSEVFLVDGGSQLSARRLADWEARLVEHGFFRIHRQTIVNTGLVEQLARRGSSYVVRVGGVAEPLAVARRRVTELRRILAPAG